MKVFFPTLVACALMVVTNSSFAASLAERQQAVNLFFKGKYQACENAKKVGAGRAQVEFLCDPNTVIHTSMSANETVDVIYNFYLAIDASLRSGSDKVGKGIDVEKEMSHLRAARTSLAVANAQFSASFLFPNEQ